MLISQQDLEVSSARGSHQGHYSFSGTNAYNPPRSRIDKVNAELVTLTYGTIVAQLCRDYESDYIEVNKQLDKMGYNIGLRLIEDYLAKSQSMRRCANFRETADMISKVSNMASIYRSNGGRRTVKIEANTTHLGRIQNLPQHNPHHRELDRR